MSTESTPERRLLKEIHRVFEEYRTSYGANRLAAERDMHIKLSAIPLCLESTAPRSSWPMKDTSREP